MGPRGEHPCLVCYGACRPGPKTAHGPAARGPPSACRRGHPSCRPASGHHSRTKTTESGARPIRCLTGCCRPKTSRAPWGRSLTSPNRRALAELASRAKTIPSQRALKGLGVCLTTSLGVRDGQPPRDRRGRLMSGVSQGPWGQSPRSPSQRTLAARRSRMSRRPSGGRAPTRRAGPGGGHCYRGSRRRGSGSPRKIVSSEAARVGCAGIIPSIISLRSSFHWQGVLLEGDGNLMPG